MLDSEAITKTQSILLIVVVVVAAVGGGAAYVLLNEGESPETIKIGVLANLDSTTADIWQGVILAKEQINEEGGILGRQVEVVGEDHDGGIDAALTSTALARLITYHKVDFIIGSTGASAFTVQDIVSEHRKIFFDDGGLSDELTQRVLDDYDNYKFYFMLTFNATSQFQGITDSLLLCREMTGFNRVGYLCVDMGWSREIMEGLDSFLPENGFDLVYKGKFPAGTFDFTSYFAAAETAGVEILVPWVGADSAISFMKEYHARQAPMVAYGGVVGVASMPKAWEMTDGKCEYISVASYPAIAGYPLSTETLPFREAYRNRWGESPDYYAVHSFDLMRFVLPDAIERAGTIETEAVIEALEETSIETSSARNFVFTKSHAVMMGENPNDPDADHMLIVVFQWQDGEMVPVYPKKIMEEAGSTYLYPPWPGPWD